MYSKFPGKSNKEQSVLLDKEQFFYAEWSKGNRERRESQSPICKTSEQQPRSLSSQVDLESFSQ